MKIREDAKKRDSEKFQYGSPEACAPLPLRTTVKSDLGHEVRSPPAEKRVLRREQVKSRLGMSIQAIYDKLDKNSKRYDPTFPRQIKLGKVAVGWIEAEIDAWLESRIAMRDGGLS